MTESMEKDCFDVNNDIVFNYNHQQHGNAYHVFGKQKIKRDSMLEYKWIIQTSDSFEGRLGIIDDTNNASNQQKNGSSIHGHKAVAVVGTHYGGYHGTLFGSDIIEMRQFIMKSDLITIHLSYANNTITFKSKNRNKAIIKTLRDGVECIRFIADIYSKKSTIKLSHRVPINLV